MIKGELGLNIKKITIRKYNEDSYEMTFHTYDNGFLHIVGDNNLNKLLKDALEDIIEM
ncbi:MAG: hypothetical protein ACOYI4_01860 [Christensenellales bacterium]|jgi:hypothetical protein